MFLTTDQTNTLQTQPKAWQNLWSTVLCLAFQMLRSGSVISWQMKAAQLTSASLNPATKQEPWKDGGKETSWHHRNGGRIHSVSSDRHSSQRHTTAHTVALCVWPSSWTGTYIMHSESCIHNSLMLVYTSCRLLHQYSFIMPSVRVSL